MSGRRGRLLVAFRGYALDLLLPGLLLSGPGVSADRGFLSGSSALPPWTRGPVLRSATLFHPFDVRLPQLRLQHVGEDQAGLPPTG